MSTPSGKERETSLLAPSADDSPTLYKAAFWLTVILTFVFFATAVVMTVLVPEPSQQQETLFTSCDFAWKAGFGVIVGLIGGRKAAT